MPDSAILPAAQAGTVTLADLSVNRMGFGAMRITGEGVWGYPPDRDEAVRVLRRAVELGVDFIDTADSYGPESSENLIAEALYPYPDGLVIATKGGHTKPGPGKWDLNGTPAHLRKACEGSLRRLHLEQIPLYQFHRPDPAVPYEESIGALVSLQQEGLIRYIGVSNVDEDLLARARGLATIVSVQNRFNLIDRTSAAVLKTCAQDGIAFIPYAPIKGYEDSAALSRIAERHGVSHRQIVLAWELALDPVMLPIPGTGSVAHLEDNIAAAGISLDDDDLHTLSAEAGVGG